jgi:hypothetical protein
VISGYLRNHRQLRTPHPLLKVGSAGALPSTPHDVSVVIFNPPRRHHRPIHEAWRAVRENNVPNRPLIVTIVSSYAPSRGPIISHGRSALTSSAPLHHCWAHTAFTWLYVALCFKQRCKKAVEAREPAPLTHLKQSILAKVVTLGAQRAISDIYPHGFILLPP